MPWIQPRRQILQASQILLNAVGNALASMAVDRDCPKHIDIKEMKAIQYNCNVAWKQAVQICWDRNPAHLNYAKAVGSMIKPYSVDDAHKPLNQLANSTPTPLSNNSNKTPSPSVALVIEESGSNNKPIVAKVDMPRGMLLPQLTKYQAPPLQHQEKWKEVDISDNNLEVLDTHLPQCKRWVTVHEWQLIRLKSKTGSCLS